MQNPIKTCRVKEFTVKTSTTQLTLDLNSFMQCNCYAANFFVDQTDLQASCLICRLSNTTLYNAFCSFHSLLIHWGKLFFSTSRLNAGDDASSSIWLQWGFIPGPKHPLANKLFPLSLSTMAFGGVGPYHHLLCVNSSTKCIGFIRTPWMMTLVLGLGWFSLNHQVVGSIIGGKKCYVLECAQTGVQGGYWRREEGWMPKWL